MSSKATVTFYPDLPHDRTLIKKICQQKNYQVTNQISPDSRAIIKWRDTTWHEPDQNLKSISSYRKIVNYYCTDISKERVSEVFSAVFSYSLSIDPRVHNGIAVEKSNRNAAHDGEIISCPASARSDKSYSRLVNNQIGEAVCDFRVPVYGDLASKIYVKHRPVECRFSNKNTSVVLADIDIFFSKEEKRLISVFCNRLGIDLGELDVLRDFTSQRIYIIDANSTPYGPPNGLSAHDVSVAVAFYSECFEEMLESKYPT